MKRLLITAMLLLFAVSAQAQFTKGTIEMMLMGTAGSLNEKITWESNYGDVNMTDEDSETRQYAYLAITPAYYVVDRLAIELELGMRAVEGAKPVQSGIANLSFTYPIRRSYLAPYVRAGAGIANALSVPNFSDLVPMTRLDEFDVTILQAGVGMKLRTGPSGLVRFEVNYRHQSFSWEGEVTKVDHKVGTISLMVGVGLMM